MSNPSFSNIDLWLFELAEGNLSEAQIEQLELFLLQHPELDVDRDVWAMAKVDKTPLAFPAQEKLERKRPFGWYAIGASSAISAALIGWYMLSGPVLNETQTPLAFKSSASRGLRILVKNNGGPDNGRSTFGEQIAHEEGMFNASNPVIPALPSGHIQSPVIGQFIAVHAESVLSSGIPEVRSSQQQQESSPMEVASHEVLNSINNAVSADLMSTTIDRLDINRLTSLTDPAYDRNLLTLELENVDVLDESVYDLAVDETEKSHGIYGVSSSEYKISFKSKLNAFSRKVQRMMDNPVALKNFRDPYYHVPGLSAIDVNFSSTGTMLSTRVQAVSRLQWFGQENEQLMNQLSVDGYAYGIRGGIGLQVSHSMYKDGGINVANAAITYSPKFSISRTISVEPSVRFKMGNKSLTKSKMEDVSQVEVERGNAHDFYPNGKNLMGKELWYQDLGAGLMVNTEWFFAGFQVDNLFRHQDNVYGENYASPRRSDYHFIGTIGTDWVSRKENLSLSPYLVYQKNEKLSEAWLGANFRWNWLTVGGAVSSKMEPAASLGLKFEHFALSYNADYVESVMTGQRALSHQLTLRIVGNPSRFGKRLLNL